MLSSAYAENFLIEFYWWMTIVTFNCDHCLSLYKLFFFHAKKPSFRAASLHWLPICHHLEALPLGVPIGRVRLDICLNVAQIFAI